MTITRKTLTLLTVAALMAALTGCGDKAMENTITQQEAEDRVETYIGQAMSVLPAHRLEPGLIQTTGCDDPTDNGPQGRVFAQHAYWIRDLPKADNDRHVDSLRRWFSDNGFAIARDNWDANKFISLEKSADGFRMSLRSTPDGDLTIGASSPCVWPNGTPSS